MIVACQTANFLLGQCYNQMPKSKTISLKYFISHLAMLNTYGPETKLMTPIIPEIAFLVTLEGIWCLYNSDFV